MATLILENLPDDLMVQIQQLAQQQHQTVNDMAIDLLKQSLQKTQPPLKFLISPETDPTWEERRKAVPEVLAKIRSQPRVNPVEFGLLDSTDLIREDRER